MWYYVSSSSGFFTILNTNITRRVFSKLNLGTLFSWSIEKALFSRWTVNFYYFNDKEIRVHSFYVMRRFLLIPMLLDPASFL